MLYFFSRAGETRICEVRLHADGEGYELVVRENGGERVERFSVLDHLLRREHELIQSWRGTGWSLAGPQPKAR